MPSKRRLKDAARDQRVLKKSRADNVKTAPTSQPDSTWIPILDQRQIAKFGMVSSLAALVASSLFKGVRHLHPWAGWALIGFSLWHHFLNQPPSRKKA